MIPRFPRVHSPALILMAILSLASACYLWTGTTGKIEEVKFWIFADSKEVVYRSAAGDWNRGNRRKISVQQVGNLAIMQRMRSGFFLGTPVADLIELHPLMMQGVFNGPLEAVGFTDFTDILHQEGLYEKFNEPSFAP